VKRALITLAALLVCGALGSTARAQTPAQVAKFNRYLSTHPATAQRLAASQGLGTASQYAATYPSSAYLPSTMGSLLGQNYSSAYQTQYMKNLATYNNWMNTHPALAAAGIGPYTSVSPYTSGYTGQYPYTQQLASSPITALVAPFMSGTPLQNYGGYGGYGGYSGAVAPMVTSAMPMAYPGSYGAYSPYATGAYPSYAAGSMPPPWHHHHWNRNLASSGQFSGNGFFAPGNGAARHAAWMASHPYASAAHHQW
jgi:hypothetical protein